MLSKAALVAGIDGGQSSSVCVIGADERHILARVTGPSCDLVGERPGSSRQADTIDSLIANARVAAGLGDDVDIAVVVAGVSGWDDEIAAGPPPRTPNVRIVHDSDVAHAGAFDGGPGLLVIAGTGSVALGIDAAGRRALAGGWGYFFGDEGSALWIARTSLRFAMEEFDRERATSIASVARTAFGVGTLREIQDGFARGYIDRRKLASFAPALVELSRTDPGAKLVVRAAARALAELASIVADRLDCSEVSYAGGLFGEATFVSEFTDAVRTLRPRLQVRSPVLPPEAGALLLARRHAAPGAAR